MDGGTTPGDCSRISTSRQRTLALPTLQISRMIYWAATGGGGCSNSPIPMLTLSSARSGSSNNLLPHQHILTRALAIYALLPFGSGVLATGWILNWGAIQVSLDLIPRPDRKCRFCSSTALGDEYHAFKCSAFLDLQVFCDINVSSKPQFITLMSDFPLAAQRYITLLTSRIKLLLPPHINQQLNMITCKYATHLLY